MKRALQNQVRKNLLNPIVKLSKGVEGARFELLESRLFLSGTVLASLSHGSLIVRGDNSANAIVLDQVGLNANQVRISSSDNTDINGQLLPVVISGVTRGVTIETRGGADSVTLTSMSLPGSVSISTPGRGSILALNNVQVAASLSIQNSSSLSTTTVSNTIVGGDLSILPGRSGQNIALRAVDVQRSTSIDGGNGANTIAIDDSTFQKAMQINTGDGADVVQIDSNGAPLGVPTVFHGDLSISLGKGDDTLQLGVDGESGNHSLFDGKEHFRGQGGRDTLLDADSATYSGIARSWAMNFESTTPAPDTTPPTVTSIDPANNSIDVVLNKEIATNFSEAMDPLTISAADVTVTAPNGVPVLGTVTYIGTTETFIPTNPLAANTVYTETITTSAKDLAGNSLASNFVSTFTTGATLDTTAPTVSFTSPTNQASGVSLNKKIVATFSEPMDPTTITAANVSVTSPGGIPIFGSVAYAGTTMTFTPSSPLAPNTIITSTITTGVTDLARNPMASNYVWTFTTGATLDTTAPTVSSTDPVNNATGVATNKKISATFSEPMDLQTITAANVKVTGPGTTSVSGVVAYVGTTMTFSPTNPLAANTLFTATITTGAKDLAGNPLANNFVWSFKTGTVADTTAPTVTSTNPTNIQTNVPINNSVAATFSESMDPLTITAASFKLAGPGVTPVTGTVNYDSASMIATFTPSANMAPNTTFTATISGGVNGAKDLAGNPLATDKVWTFTTGTQIAQAPINLGSASTFAVMATASISNSGPSIINGDVGLNPGSSQGIPPAQVNGTIHVDDQAVIKAQSDLLAAYNDAVSRSVTSVSLPGNMGGLTFTPGLYTNSTSVLIQGAGPANNVTLDAQGNPNAIFIFQMGSTLTTGPGAQVILAGGAKASNIFWQVGTSATLNTTTIFKGSILAAVSITVNTGSVIDGRLLGGANSNGSVTVNASTVTVPST